MCLCMGSKMTPFAGRTAPPQPFLGGASRFPRIAFCPGPARKAPGFMSAFHACGLFSQIFSEEARCTVLFS